MEASRSFGATRWQLLYKVQLPLALPTILTGVNQTIMMSLSMVVIAAMIAAGGLGEIVLKGITQMKIGLGFEGGIAVVILAIILDRITQGMAGRKKQELNGKDKIRMRIYKIVGIVLSAILLLASCTNSDLEKKKVKIAYANWLEGIAMSHLAKVVLEEHGYEVELQNADLAPIFVSMSGKKSDVFLDAWLPITMKDYMDQYGDSIEFLGEVYGEARVGLVVPQICYDSVY